MLVSVKEVLNHYLSVKKLKSISKVDFDEVAAQFQTYQQEIREATLSYNNLGKL